MPAALYVIDARVADSQFIIERLPQDAYVLTLDAATDGLTQVASFLSGREPVDSLHIITHGASGTLHLGSTVLTQNTLEDRAEALDLIGQGLTADGDVLLYGCNVAQGVAGQAFMERLAALTGADVAASTDLTGAGGDWVLEAQRGGIEVATLTGVAGYTATLDVFADTTGNDSLVGTPGDDTFTGGTGNDTLDGGAGNDVVTFSGVSSGYRFGLNTSGQVTITDTNTANGNDGVEVLLGVEEVRFADGAVRVAGLQEVRVNTYTSGAQSSPVIATLADGGYVVVWQSEGQDGSGYGVYSQRYAADGSPQGAEALVNTTINYDQSQPAVTALANGGYIVVWAGSDASGLVRIYGQRYDVTGVAQSGEVVLSTTAGSQYSPAVAPLLDGGYVVAWYAYNSADSGTDGDILSRRFDADGVALGDDIRVNSYTAEGQYSPVIAGLASGGYVVVWASMESNARLGVRCQRYAADGSPQGGETLVNTTTDSDQSEPSVAALADGGYIVVWSGNGADSSGIYGQCYGADGTAQGGEIQINSDYYSGYGPSVSALSDGGYVVTWYNRLDDAGYGVCAQRFAADGSLVGSELRINTTTEGDQTNPVVSALSDGGYMVVWADSAKDGSGFGIYSQRVDAYNNLLAVQLTGDAASNTLNWFGTGNIFLDGGAGNDTLTGSFGADHLRGGMGADSMAGGAGNDVYEIDTTGDVVTENPYAGTDTVRSGIAFTLPVNVENLDLTGSAAVNGAGNDLANALTGNMANNLLSGGGGNDTLRGGGGGDTLAGGLGDDLVYVDSVSDVVLENANEGTDTVSSSVNHTLAANVENLILTGAAVSGAGNGLANTLTGTSANNALNGGGGADTLSGGDGDDTLTGGAGNDTLDGAAGNDVVTFSGSSAGYSFGINASMQVIVTDTNTADGNDGTDVLLGVEQVRFADGVVRVTELQEIQVNTHTSGNQDSASIATLADGGYVVVWTSDGQDGSGWGVYSQRYGADHTPQGAETLVNTTTESTQGQPTVAALVGGGYIVVWTGNGAVGWGIYGQRYGSDGTAQGGEVLLSASINSGQDRPVVEAFSDGGYVVAWSEVNSSNDSDIFTQRFDADGVAIGYVALVNSYTIGTQHAPTISCFEDGSYMVFWDSYDNNGSGYIIYSQRYDACGSSQGMEKLAFSSASSPAVATLSDGDYIVSFQRGGDINCQRYGVNGVMHDGEMEISNRYYHSAKPEITALSDGGYVVVWDSYESYGVGYNVYAQRFAGDGSRVGSELLINTTTTGDQTNSVVSALPDGGYMVVWTDNARDENGSGIYCQCVDADNNLRPILLTGDSAANTVNWSGTGSSAFLDGGTGNDTLVGGSGSDQLRGGLGADSMAGGTGDDVYEVDDVGDTITEHTSAGTDTVRSTVTFSLAVNVENLKLIGSAIVNGTGNDLANTITGNAAKNLLSGGGGNDTLRGGGGADTFAGGLGDDLMFVDSASDVVRENAKEGTDTVSSSVNHTLAANVENLILTGAAVSGTGNALSNVLIGTNADNVLSGRAGNDTLDSGAGNDVVIFSGSSAGYSFGVNANRQVIVTDTNTADGNDGTDTLLGVEQVRFADGTVRVAEFQEVRVNTHTKGEQRCPNIATFADASYVVVWQSYNQDGNGSVVYSQRYAADDNPTGAETLVNVTTDSYPGQPVVAALSDGGYIVAWSGYGTAGWGIYGQRYGADGTAQGGEALLSNSVNANQAAPVVTALVDGGYAVAWHLSNGWGQDVFARRFDSDGLARESVFLVNSNTFGSQYSPAIAGLADGGYVVVWTSDNQDGSFSGVYSQRYGADGHPQGAETLVNTSTNGSQCLPNVAALSDGGYIVVWSGDGANGYDIYGQRYGADGTAQGGEVRISSATYSDYEPSVTALSDGGYVVVWYSYNPDNTSCGVYAQRFAADGSQVGSELRLNTASTGYQSEPVVSALPAGGYMVVWTDSARDGSGSGIFSQRVNASNNLRIAQLTGDDAANTLNWSGRGSVILDGGAGNDTLGGGDSPDQLRGGDGVDTADYSASATGVVADLVAGTAGDDHLSSIENIVGSAHDDSLSGNGGANLLSGLGGNDTLLGRLGNDTLLGGAGNDTLNGGVGNDSMIGGLGDDLYVVDNVGDKIEELTNQGADTVQSSINFTLGQDVEHLLLTGGAVSGSGNTLDNRMTGNAAANRLDGGAGNDTLLGNGGNDTLSGGAGNDMLNGGLGNDSMLGGLGNDVYIVDSAGDRISETSTLATEVDTVQSSVTWTLGANLENLILTGVAAINGNGNILANAITGNGAANVLNGGTGNDTLTGGAGNDMLNGGAGNDSMIGGQGNDTYIVDSTDDRITEWTGQGTDAVRSSVSWTLGANLENLVLTGTTDIAGLGNALANRITGNSAGNVLNGRAGADTLAGGGGHDTYYVDNSGDVIVELANQGSDVVISTVSHILAANVEGLYLAGGAAINGAGNGQANLLRGNGSGNALNGAAGADTLEGGLGRDSLTGGTGADQFVFNTALSAGNVDAITDFAHGVDKIVLDADIFTQAGSEGMLTAGAFRKGAGLTSGGDADDRIILNITTGALYYDADGNGAGAAVQFATLAGTSAIGTVTAADFLVVA